MKKAAVLGLGESVLNFERKGYDWVVGVNDILRHFPQPDIVDEVLTVDAPKAFPKDRLKHFKKAHIVSQIKEWIAIGLGFSPIEITRYSNKAMDEGKICFSNNSPFVAITYLYQKGFTQIDVYGVDVVGHRHLGTGNNYYSLLDDYRHLLYYLELKGVDVNLHCRLKELLNE